ncbi:MAG: hypothetical protein IKW90_06890 [Lachnospiraceae bacterium]|nr:hypothetical protein [Lachnospiraceae bacterium]
MTNYIDNIQNLINAIIECAALDYRQQYRDYIKSPTYENARYLILNRRYFEEDCNGLTSLGDYIVRHLEEEEREKFSQKELMVADIMIGYATREERPSMPLQASA